MPEPKRITNADLAGNHFCFVLSQTTNRANAIEELERIITNSQKLQSLYAFLNNNITSAQKRADFIAKLKKSINFFTSTFDNAERKSSLTPVMASNTTQQREEQVKLIKNHFMGMIDAANFWKEIQDLELKDDQKTSLKESFFDAFSVKSFSTYYLNELFNKFLLEMYSEYEYDEYLGALESSIRNFYGVDIDQNISKNTYFVPAPLIEIPSLNDMFSKGDPFVDAAVQVMVGHLNDNKFIDTIEFANSEGFKVENALSHPIKNLPPSVKTIKFKTPIDITADTKNKPSPNPLKLIPPHVKEVHISELHLAHEWTFFTPSKEEKISKFIALLPPTVERAIIDGEIKELNRRPLNLPHTYNTFFYARSKDNDKIVNGMKHLLQYYLGNSDENGGKLVNELPTTTWWRTKGREHRAEVVAIIRKIDNHEITSPYQLLSELREINPQNSRGGLQMRINFLAGYLKEHPPTPELQQNSTNPDQQVGCDADLSDGDNSPESKF